MDDVDLNRKRGALPEGSGSAIALLPRGNVATIVALSQVVPSYR
jgi:hypothetical protein